MDNSASAERPVDPVARAVNVNVPAWAGVPLITPASEIVKPLGSEPLYRLQV
jgi:hypothetical protein